MESSGKIWAQCKQYNVAKVHQFRSMPFGKSYYGHLGTESMKIAIFLVLNPILTFPHHCGNASTHLLKKKPLESDQPFSQ